MHDPETAAPTLPSDLTVGSTRRPTRALQPIERPYLMVSLIPYYQDGQGNVWLERLWYRDFMRHLAYIKCFTLLGPRRTLADAKGVDVVRVEVPEGVVLRFQDLPIPPSRLRALLRVPKTARKIWSAVSEAEIVHTGVAGWPYPVGWLANISASLRRKELLIYVESAPWRLAGTTKPSVLRRAEAVLYETAARWSINRASISFFTHQGYRESLLTRGRGPGFVLPASWIDEQDIVGHAQLHEAWLKKLARPGARFLFVGRLGKDKGVEVLLNAIALLRQRNVELTIDFIGSGDLAAACQECAGQGGSVSVHLLEPVPYESLLPLLRSYHAVLVPSLSDEQPRIVFDAYSQGVPVLASATSGLTPYVFEGSTGMLVPPGCAEALAEAIACAAATPASLERLGHQALDYAGSITHHRMHVERWTLMRSHLVSLRQDAAAA